jgi:hypothetical protein
MHDRYFLKPGFKTSLLRWNDPSWSDTFELGNQLLDISSESRQNGVAV